MTHRSIRYRALNLIGFQLGWFGCVLGAARGWGWLGPLLVALLVFLNLRFGSDRVRELRLLTLAAVVGTLTDSLQGWAGFLVFNQNPFPEWISPPWMMAMWINFALTLHSSFGWLAGRYWLGSLLGAVGGPAAYLAGARLGGLRFGIDAPWALAIVAGVWALVLPLILFMDRRWSSRP